MALCLGSHSLSERSFAESLKPRTSLLGGRRTTTSLQNLASWACLISDTGTAAAGAFDASPFISSSPSSTSGIGKSPPFLGSPGRASPSSASIPCQGNGEGTRRWALALAGGAEPFPPSWSIEVVAG